MNLVISVVICTYNRQEMLKGCLKSLFEQDCDLSKFEVIVIDNNSTDETHMVAQLYETHSNFRYVLETKQGLGYARNRGLTEAQGQYVAYIDDDVQLPPGCLRVVLELITTTQPSPHCLGGPILPFYTTPKPDWFKDKYEIRMLGEDLRYLKRGQSFIGAFMIWMKKALEEMGGFNVDLGVKGDYLAVGEDTAAFHKMWLLNEKPQFLFSPRLMVYHWVPKEQMKVVYRLKRNFAEGFYLYHEFCPTPFTSRVNWITQKLFALTISCLRAILKLRQHQKLQNWVVEEFSRPSIIVGEMAGLFGINLKLNNRIDNN